MKQTKTNIFLGQTVFMIAIAFGASQAMAYETDLKPVKKPDDKKVKMLETEVVDTSFDEEVEENDTESYDAAARAMRAETKRLQGEIAITNERIQKVRMKKDEAKGRAAIAQQDLEVQKQQAVLAKTRLTDTIKAKQAADLQVAKLKAELAKVKQEESTALEEVRKYSVMMKLAEDERRETLNKTQQAKDNIETQQTRAANAEVDYKNYRRETARLEAAGAKANANAGARAINSVPATAPGANSNAEQPPQNPSEEPPTASAAAGSQQNLTQVK